MTQIKECLNKELIMMRIISVGTATVLIAVVLIFSAKSALSIDCSPSNIRCVDDTAGPNQEYSTIQACANAVVAGDTCVVFDGTYGEPMVIVKKGGNPQNRITFKADGNVIMKGFYLRNSSIIINGFNITGFKGLWASFIDTKDVRDLRDLHIWNNIIRDGNQLLLDDIYSYDGGFPVGRFTSARGGFISAGFEVGNAFHVNCVNSSNTSQWIYVGDLVIQSIDNNSMSFTRLSNTPELPIAAGPVTCNMFINTYGISMDADGFSIINNTMHNLWGNFININLGAKNGLVESNEIFNAHGWDIFRAFGQNHTIRNNFVHDSDAFPYIGNHPDLFQTWSYNNATISKDIVIERNYFGNMKYQISMFENKANSPYVKNWTMRNNVFYNITNQANSGMDYVQWHGNTFYKDGGTGGAGIILGMGGINNRVFNNVFLGTGGDRPSYSWYSLGGTGFYADYNYVGGSPPNYSKKKDYCLRLGALAVDNFCEENGINGGNPLFQDVSNPLGPDGKPFTSDDGLIPLSDSFLAFAGRNGVTTGAYERQGCISDSPIAYFSIEKSARHEPLEVKMNASKSLSCASSLTYEWSFGDGIAANGDVQNHIYNEGTYVIALTVRNDIGKSDVISRVISVLPRVERGLVLNLGFENDDNLLDWSGNNHISEWTGDFSYAPGKKGFAASFNGLNKTLGNMVMTRHSSDLDGMDELTISFWAKKNIFNESNIVIAKHVTYRVDLLRSGFSVNLYNRTSSAALSTNLGGNDTYWHHYLATYNGSLIRLYVDGAETASRNFSGRIAVNPDRAIAIGKDVWGDSFNGMIDEFRIYNRSLGISEIFALYNLSGYSAPACGNNIIEIGEDCDGNTRRCTANGYPGTHSCAPQCTWNATCASAERCGDGIKNGPETCDSTALACQNSAGYDGSRSCLTNCTGFGLCSQTETCGDGIKNGIEQCDDGNIINNDLCNNTCRYHASCTDIDNDGSPDYNPVSCASGKDRCIEANIGNWNTYAPYEAYNGTKPFNATYPPSEDFRNMSNFTLKMDGFAQIMFRQRIRMVDVNETGCFRPLNLSRLIEFHPRKVIVRSEDFSEFSKPAALTFTNISFISPKILKDGAECPAGLCNITSYSPSDRTLNVEIAGFSTYEVVEGYIPPAQQPLPAGGTGGGGISGATAPVSTQTTNTTPAAMPAGAYVCQQGARRCTGSVLEGCGQDGRTWTEIEACASGCSPSILACTPTIPGAGTQTPGSIGQGQQPAGPSPGSTEPGRPPLFYTLLVLVALIVAIGIGIVRMWRN